MLAGALPELVNNYSSMVILNIISDILLRTNNSSYLLLGFFGFLGFTQTDGVIHRNEFIMDGVQDA